MPGSSEMPDRLVQAQTRADLNLRRPVKRQKHRAPVSLYPLPTNDSDPHLAKPKVTKPSKKSTTTKKGKLSRASSHNTDREDDSGGQPTIPKPAQRKLKESSAKLPPTQTDDESDDLAIKKNKVSGRIDKGKARATETPPETFESAGTDVDVEDSRPGPSNVKLLSAEEKSLRDIPPDVYEKTTVPIISRVTFDRGDTSDEEQKQKQPPKKRGRPRKDGAEGEPPPKRGKIQGVSDNGDGEDLPQSKPEKQVKKQPPKSKPATTKGRTRKKADPPPDTSDEEREEGLPAGTEPPGSDTRKRRRRMLSDGSDDEKRDEQDGDGDGSSSNPNRVRLDSIPPEGLIIRKKNGIVERLLPPVAYVQLLCLRRPHLTPYRSKPKRKTSSNKGKTRSSQKRAIPAHVLKYIGPTRFGSPLKADGTDTDDDLNL